MNLRLFTKDSLRLPNIVVFCLAMLLSHYASARSFTADVGSRSIGINESVLLTVRLEDSQRLSRPDFRGLNSQFEVLSNSQQVHRTISNGKSRWIGEWQLLLSPKQAGDLVIPSFIYNGLATKTITIEVSRQKTVNKVPKDEIFLRMEIDKKQLYVQEQLLVRLKLHTRIPLSDYSIEPPRLDNAAIEEVAQKQERILINNINYTVLDITYAVYPQQSGRFTLPAVNWTVEKGNQTQRFFNDGFGLQTPSRNRQYTITSESQDITVLPVPDSFTGKHWLPASDITLTETWGQSLFQAKVGEPLQRTIQLGGRYLSSAQLPTITMDEHPHFKFYQDQPKLNEEKTKAGINASREESYAIIPTTPGTYTLPALNVHWWDVESKQNKLASLPAQTIVVAASQLLDTTPDSIDTPTIPNTTQISTGVTSHWLWPLISTALALLAGLFFWLWRSALQQPQAVQFQQQNLESSGSPSEAHAFKVLTESVTRGDLYQTRVTLIAWAQCFLKDSRIDSLTDIGHHLPQLHLMLARLDNQLYGAQKEASWDSQALLAMIQQLRSQSPQQTSKREALSPLYPN